MTNETKTETETKAEVAKINVFAEVEALHLSQGDRDEIAKFLRSKKSDYWKDGKGERIEKAREFLFALDVHKWRKTGDGKTNYSKIIRDKTEEIIAYAEERRRFDSTLNTIDYDDENGLVFRAIRRTGKSGEIWDVSLKRNNDIMDGHSIIFDNNIRTTGLNY